MSACLDIPGDALDPRAAADVVTAAVDTYGSVDVALLNAGQGPDMSMDEVSVAEISRIMALNYDAVVVNYLIPLVQQMGSQPDGGLIAHTNSLAGLIGVPRQGPYGAAKAAARKRFARPPGAPRHACRRSRPIWCVVPRMPGRPRGLTRWSPRSSGRDIPPRQTAHEQAVRRSRCC